ncbi:MAG TPA: chemotaxis-specific protein-glutamate methyltransferase CheB [Chloroflexota bacterium]|jgi:two-component system chemotaxis response regulator CheB
MAAGASGRIRVLVVEDSATQRGMLMAALATDPELEVAGWATNGAEAVRAAALLKPDVITMDLRMPVMDGLEATRRIMLETPTPIVMVSSHLAPSDRQLAIEALEIGVLSIVAKPEQVRPGTPNLESIRDLLQAVKSMARVKMVRRWAPERLRPTAPPVAPTRPPTAAWPAAVVAIGASTGGPPALQQILSALPADFAPPVLVVQHIAPGFEAGLAVWLQGQCALPVELAAPGRPLDRPGIVLARSGQHLVAQGGALSLTHDPPVGGHRPSATVLFQAIAREYGPRAVGVLLTGMGEDGAAGLRDLKRRGATTIAQDEASSVVFGMPGAAIALGVADHVLPPPSIGPLLVALAGREHGR